MNQYDADKDSAGYFASMCMRGVRSPVHIVERKKEKIVEPSRNPHTLILLAAGDGGRMIGRCKQLLEMPNGKTLLRNIVDNYTVVLGGDLRVVLVGGAYDAEAMAALSQIAGGKTRMIFLQNPVWPVSYNLTSLFLASDYIGPNTVIANGDTLVHPETIYGLCDSNDPRMHPDNVRALYVRDDKFHRLFSGVLYIPSKQAAGSCRNALRGLSFEYKFYDMTTADLVNNIKIGHRFLVQYTVDNAFVHNIDTQRQYERAKRILSAVEER